MFDQVKAVYENGVFRPLNPIDLEEGQEVRLVISPTNSDAQSQHRESHMLPPLVSDESDRARLLQEIVREMSEHPCGNPPRLTRDDLHERG